MSDWIWFNEKFKRRLDVSQLNDRKSVLPLIISDDVEISSGREKNFVLFGKVGVVLNRSSSCCFDVQQSGTWRVTEIDRRLEQFDRSGTGEK